MIGWSTDVQCQAITWAIDGSSLIEPFRRNHIDFFFFKEVHMELSPANYWPFHSCPYTCWWDDIQDIDHLPGQESYCTQSALHPFIDFMRCIWQAAYMYKNWHFFWLLIVIIWYIEDETNGRHFPDGILKCILLNEILFDRYITEVRSWGTNWQYSSIGSGKGDKQISQPMGVSLLAHLCVVRPQRVNFTACRYSLPTDA